MSKGHNQDRTRPDRAEPSHEALLDAGVAGQLAMLRPEGETRILSETKAS